jgi:hypothetical protein
MQTIQQILKNTAVNGVISVERAMIVARKLDEERAVTVDLLKKCERNVGMDLGEDINKHIAGITGAYFNAVDYHYEAMPADQRI